MKAMNINDEQYERIARRLDGSQSPLSEQEQAAADDIARDENWLSRRLDPGAPGLQRAMACARNRLAAAVAARPRRSVYMGYAASVMSAAALILMTFSFITMMQGGADVETPVTVSPPDDLLFSPPQNNYDIAIIATQMDEFEADLASSSLPGEIDVWMNELQDDMDEFWLYDSLYAPDFSEDSPA